MTTPTTMITSMITTVTTMMTDVVVAPSVGVLLVGCKLLTGTIPVVVVGPMVWERMVSSGNDAVEWNQNVKHICVNTSS